MPVITVLGEIDSEKLGITSVHEHVLVDLRHQFLEFSEISRRVLSEQKVGLENLDVLSRNPYAVRDNMLLDDVEVAEKELERFYKAGGDTIVDVTSKDIGRDPGVLRDISRSTGINIITGCGYYTYDTHPKDMENKTVEDIKKEMLIEINEGIDGSRIRAGVIGEIGTSKKVHPQEEKSLAASAQVQAETGLGLHIHTYPWSHEGIKIINILKENGANIEKVAINHMDIEFDIEYCTRIMDTGSYIEFDNFGHEFYVDKRNWRGFVEGLWAKDTERIKKLKSFIKQGYLSKILIATDICMKTGLHKFGGWGYDHLLTNIIPMMNEEGITNKEIDTLLILNPKKFLDN